jgi:hypothetical protein
MKSLDSEFTKNYLAMTEAVEKLANIIKHHNLPDDLNNPETQDQVDEVGLLSVRVYNLGCDIAQFGEDMMVGDQVQDAFDNKEEQSMTYSEKLADVGHKEGDF